jgi:flavin reductase (DIM6/NTAB) family NADH-FMN oxidoreductase RutF
MPLPAALVSCQREGEKPNIITIAWIGVACSRPPILALGIRPGRYSHAIIRDSGQLVVNIPSGSLLKKVDWCGFVSGRDRDKFDQMGLTPIPGRKVRPPLIGECPVNLECQLRQVIPLGSHDLFLAEVVALWADEEVLDENGKIDVARSDPLAYCAGAYEYWGLSPFLGRYGDGREGSTPRRSD